jgi:hypothetical protein
MAAFIGLVWLSSAGAPTEPVYQGRKLSAWLKVFNYRWQNDPALSERDARRALRDAGTNAVPTLMRMLRATDSPLKLKVNWLLQKQHWFKVNIRSAADIHLEAEEAFRELGVRAVPAIPELAKMCDENLPVDTKAAVINVLGTIGPADRLALSALQLAAASTNSTVSAVATSELRNINQSRQGMSGVESRMMENLTEQNPNVRLQAAMNLVPGPFGGRTATDTLVDSLLYDLQAQPSNYWVKFTLETMDPTVAARVLTNDFKDNAARAPIAPVPLASLPANRAEPVAVGEWSEVEREGPAFPKLRGRLLLYPPIQKTAGQSRVLPVEIELEDVSAAMGQAPGSFYFDFTNSVVCELTDASSNTVPAKQLVFNSTPGPVWLTVPFDGTSRFRADSSDLAEAPDSGGLSIEVGRRSWNIAAGDTNAYFLSVRFKPMANPTGFVIYPDGYLPIQIPAVKIPPLQPDHGI